MVTNLISKKSWANAAAFIEVDAQGNTHVYGKFFDNGRGFPGPSTEILAIMPEELRVEALSTTWCDEHSPELEAFCDDVWERAKAADDWFSY